MPALTDAQLTGPSGASDWSVAQVLSHLGIGAEIALAVQRAALNGEPAPGQEFNTAVWDLWNALTARQQATGFLERDAAVVQALEALSPQQRENTPVKLGFLPEPLPLASAIGMRLGEVAQHSWDVRVALDLQAEIGADAAGVLLEQYTGGLGFLLGFFGKADRLAAPAVVALGDSAAFLVIDDSVHLSRSAGEPTAPFDGEIGAAVPLLDGRLEAPYLPSGLRVTGLSLDDLQRVFPGF